MVSFAQTAEPRINIGMPDSDPSVPSRTTWGDAIPVRDPGIPLAQYTGAQAGIADPVEVWRKQPSVRKVVDFIARNIAMLPWHAYVRVSDTDRQRARDSLAERALEHPRRFQSGFDLWRKVVTDACLYDAWCVALLPARDGSLVPTRISPRVLRLDADQFGNITGVWAAPAGTPNDRTTWLNLGLFPLALSTGWAGLGAGGVSPLVTLSALLAEQSHAVEWRNALWTNGPKVSGILKRPLEAKRWEPVARDNFLATWREWKASTAGGTPLLEDGMDYQVLEGVKPADAKDIEGRQLTDAEVASAFHIAPELVGARQGTFANVAAFRQMLFGPALGPRIEELQQAVNMELAPALDGRDGLYVELDRDSAINGSLAEQASVLSTSVGQPWMTPNEARAKQNLPALEGGDTLAVPLNVTQGGQASPTDSGAQNQDPTSEPTADDAPGAERKALTAGPRRVVVKASQYRLRDAEDLQDAITDLLAQQAASVKAGDRPDRDAWHEQWDALAAAAVKAHLVAASTASARDVLTALKAEPDAWSEEASLAYLDAMADSTGGQVAVSGLAVVEASEPDTSDEDLRTAMVAGAAVLAVTAARNAAGFGAFDAAQASGAASKTWQTGGHPRASHKALDGETVGLDDLFSNGLKWPGDSRGSADETANCNCGVEFTTED